MHRFPHRLLMFGHFRLSRFVNRILCFRNLFREAFKDFPGHQEMLFQQERYLGKNFILCSNKVLELW